MRDTPKVKTFRPSAFFSDGLSARPLVPGTVPQGDLEADELLYRGTVNGQPSTVFPFPVTKQVIERGQSRYEIFCSPCHSRVGDGNGMIVQRGYRRPPSFHIDRLRQAPVGHFFDVITRGFGAMPSYASRVSPQDRWAIIAYTRVLQFSQNAPVASLPPEDRQQVSRVSGGAK